MFKIIILLVLIVCSHSQLDINRQLLPNLLRNVNLRGQAVGIAPIQARVAVAPQQVVQEVRSEDTPVVIQFEGQSVPVEVKSSHLDNTSDDVTVRSFEDKPHRVVHEIIRPVIQEVREIIQPYRRITQEVRPVEDLVHTQIATGGGVSANTATVSAPVQTLVAQQQPVQRFVAQAPVQALVAQTPASLGISQFQSLAPTGIRYAAQAPSIAVGAPTQTLFTAPSPTSLSLLGFADGYEPGSYIRQYIEQLRARPHTQSLGFSVPTQGLAYERASALQQFTIPSRPLTVERPVALNIAHNLVRTQSGVGAQQLVRRGGGGQASITRKYVEYDN